MMQIVAWLVPLCLALVAFAVLVPRKDGRPLAASPARSGTRLAAVDAGDRGDPLPGGDRDGEMLRELLADEKPAVRSAALDLALAMHDLDAVCSAIGDPVVAIAARAALEYAAQTSQAACDAKLSALEPAHAEQVRARLAVAAF
ncbi:MAG: hypothetical protein WCE44_06460 [Candidatus Velthaea sp.]|jgi:hypothetical protein